MIKTYAQRRAALIASMQAAGGGVAIIPTAREKQRNSDADFPFRHDSYFYYLSGFTEPEAVIVLLAGSTPELTQSILFCRSKNLERELWEGFRYGPEAAASTFGFDCAYPIEQLDTEMVRLLQNVPALYYRTGLDLALDTQVNSWLAKLHRQVGLGITAPAAIHNVQVLLDAMRNRKDDSEIAIMRRAAEISAEGHALAMRTSQPGLREYHLEAELLYTFRKHGAQFPAYTSIVAGGANACILHYRAGDTVLQNGELVLIDAGCELDSYASDITRTFPVNGKFSEPQKILYQIVLTAQQAAIDMIKPGNRFIDVHQAALRVLAQGMLDTGLLKADKVGTLDDVLANENYRQFYMHRTSHWIGMDVHDVGAYHDAAEPGSAIRQSRALQPGMALTVEPGMYVRPTEDVPEAFWNIGIRIEDDALVTAQGCEILSHGAPKSVADIEKMMKH